MARIGNRGIQRLQRGMSLIVTLIALILLSYAGLALLRSVDTATLISGNLSFQEAALASGDAATETAIAWLSANAGGTTLFADVSVSGYYATSADNCDLTGSTLTGAANDVAWAGGPVGADCGMVAVTLPGTTVGIAPGYTVAYVINRICNAPGDPNSTVAADGSTAMICAQYPNPLTSNASTHIGASYGSMPLLGLPQHYYRITTRISGPRNTVRFVQAFVVL